MTEDFDAWWHNAYFRTDHPLHGIYGRLFKAGADLDYVDGLTRILRVGDQDSLYFRNDLETNLPDKLRHLAHPSAIAKLVKVGIREFAAKKGVSLTEAEYKDLERYVHPKVQKRVAKHQQETTKANKETVQKILKTNPIGAILYEYSSAPLVYRTGRRSDDLGSFFMLAVSENLRERTGRPHFSLAGNLLRAARSEREASNRTSRLQAMIRVDKLKRSSHDWKRHLIVLQESYRSFKSGKPWPKFIASLETLASLEQADDFTPTFES